MTTPHIQALAQDGTHRFSKQSTQSLKLLAGLGVEILSTGGTQQRLAASGVPVIAPVVGLRLSPVGSAPDVTAKFV